jgi:prepilin-type processing-associated H-X9-DG protein
MECPNCRSTVDESAHTCPGCEADLRVTARLPNGAAYGPYTMAEVRRYVAEARIPAGTLLERLDGISLTLTQAGVQPPPLPATMRAAPQKRSGMSGGAVCGIVAAVLLGVVVVFGGIMGAILFPVFTRAREKARQASCQANLSQLSMAVQQYATDHQNTLPDATTWQQDISQYVGGNTQLFTCPSTQQSGTSYTFNPALSRVPLSAIADPSAVPMIYDSGLAHGAGPHAHGGNVAYVDGHAKWVADSAFRLSAGGP